MDENKINDENKSSEENKVVNETTSETKAAGETKVTSETKVTEGKGNKWKVIAVCEAVALCVVLIVGAMLLSKGNNANSSQVADNTVINTQAAENMTEAVSVTGVENVKENTSNKTQAAENETDAQVNQEDSTEAVTEPVTIANLQKNDGSISVAFREDQAWESGDSQFAQHTMILENNMDEPVLAWQYKLILPEGAKITQAWGCEYTITDNVVVFTPVTYTSEIPASEMNEGVGIITEWKKDSKFDIASGEFEYSVTEEESTEAESAETEAAETETTETQTTAAGQETTEASSKETVKNETTRQPEGATPVASHGQLSVKGSDLVDENGNRFQIQGVSTHGIGWFPDYVNKAAFQNLRDDFNVNAMRIAMYTAEGAGYCTGGNKAELKKLVEEGVEYATELGMYVIIDWHILSDGNPNTYKKESVEFFKEMSRKYADYENVIYEICNEPNGGVSWSDVKSYATDVIAEIRKNDDNAVILVGTPTWSQEVDKAVSDRIKNDENVMYVLHFYAATHKDDLRNRLLNAKKAGLPIFISEFSICDASGNGGIDYDSASKWLELINDNNISYVGWNLSNKAETSALIKSGCTKTSGFTMNDLSETGKWLFESFME